MNSLTRRNMLSGAVAASAAAALAPGWTLAAAAPGGKQVAGDLRAQAENDPDVQVRKQAVFALSRLPDPEASTQLIQIASTNKDPAVRQQAVFWLGQSKDPRALNYLTKLLQQP